MAENEDTNPVQPSLGHGTGAIESAARNLVALLMNTLAASGSSASPSARITETRQPESRTVQQEMTRSFPGFFKSSIRGKKRCFPSTKHIKLATKTTTVNFYLLPRNTPHTPLPAEELELIQAGLGKKAVTLPEDADHTEISRLLTETFPKMEGLSGGWLLHKAIGGSGRRKLTVIPPETEGYSVRALKAVSGGGKATLYIVPLQETLDTCALPSDSEHFSKMPKKTCYQCYEVMPLHVLALHVKTCAGKVDSDGSEGEESYSYIAEKRAKVDCPICNGEFPEDEIALHASLCGDSFDSTASAKDNGACPSPESASCKPRSTEDVLHFLEQQVDTTKEFRLCVAREDLLERGILQWKRKKNAFPTSVLKVAYIGEAGIDTGALRKEFLTGIEERFFEGPERQGKNPKFSLTDLDSENFRTVGEIIAVSLAQGGPAPAFFKDWCYNFFCSGEVDLGSLNKEDVTDLDSALLIGRVENAADAESLMLLAEDFVNCGYTTQIKMDNKDRIIRAIILHSTTRLIPMLQQLRKGLELYGLVNQMNVNAEACRPLFVPGTITKPDADFIMMNCQPQYSEKGTSKETAERKIINFLQDFLEELEISDRDTAGASGEVSECLAVQHVLQWMTGQAHTPILPSEKQHFKITFRFDHECRERLGDHSILLSSSECMYMYCHISSTTFENLL